MNLTEQMKAHDTAIRAHLDACVEIVKPLALGRWVKLKKGKYAGRWAITDGLLIDQNKGIQVLCYVVRSDYKRDKGQPPYHALLNSDSETRSYWPIDMIDWEA